MKEGRQVKAEAIYKGKKLTAIGYISSLIRWNMR